MRPAALMLGMLVGYAERRRCIGPLQFAKKGCELAHGRIERVSDFYPQKR